MVLDKSFNEQFCSCANDVFENGVMDELIHIAKRFKFAIDDRKMKPPGRCYITLLYDNWGCHLGYGRKFSEGTVRKSYTEEEIGRLERDYLEKSSKETAEALLAAGGWRPNTLTGPEQWLTYSAMLTFSLPTNQMIRDFATFIYCKLNHPSPQNFNHVGIDYSESLY